MSHRMVQTLHLNKEFLRGGSIKILLMWANIHSEGTPQEIRTDTTERNRHRMQGESVYTIRQDLGSPAILDLGCANPLLAEVQAIVFCCSNSNRLIAQDDPPNYIPLCNNHHAKACPQPVHWVGPKVTLSVAISNSCPAACYPRALEALHCRPESHSIDFFRASSVQE